MITSDQQVLQFSKELREQIHEIKKSLDESITPYVMVSKEFSEIISSPIIDEIKALSKNASRHFAAGLPEYVNKSIAENPIISYEIHKMIRDIFKNYDFQEPFIEKPFDSQKMNLQLFSESNNDYVTVDEKVAKEWEIPENVVIPVGNNRIKIKTELLITILLTLIFWLADLAVGTYRECESTKAEEQYREEQLQLQEEGNQMLHDFINSIDSSTSSQSESINNLVITIEDLTELLQSSETASLDSDSSLEQSLETDSNNPE